MSSSRLAAVALICLSTCALVALAVAHGTSPIWFEKPAIDLLGQRSVVDSWAHLAGLLGPPTMILVLVACWAFGLARHALARVGFYSALAVLTILINEHVAKPVVDRTYYQAVTFPSGHVTAACATAFAMWLALFPLIGNRERVVTALAGLSWIAMISIAVVGALWHTPVDAVGSVLFSVGVVSAGAALFESPHIRSALATTRVRLEGRGEGPGDRPGVNDLLGDGETRVGAARARAAERRSR